MTPLSHFTLKYPSKKQIELWCLRRDQLTNEKTVKGKELAKTKNITPAAVSKALSDADARIQALLKDAARMNKIRLDLLRPELGFARGDSIIFKVRTYMTYSPANGVQVWYDHQGACEECEEYGGCRWAILQEFKERGLTVPNPALRPTDLVEVLFRRLEGLGDGRKAS